MCKFQSLYFEDDGYVVRCNHCGYYQVGFSSTMLTLSESGFQHFFKQVKSKSNENSSESTAHCKVIILKTPSPGIYMMLTCREANHFTNIPEHADSEIKALGLMRLFNPE